MSRRRMTAGRKEGPKDQGLANPAVDDGCMSVHLTRRISNIRGTILDNCGTRKGLRDCFYFELKHVAGRGTAVRTVYRGVGTGR
jgi:hypothetical protein